MFNLLLKCVRLHHEVLIVAKFFVNKFKTRKIFMYSQTQHKRPKLIKNQIIVNSEIQLFLVTVSNGCKFNTISLSKLLG